MRKWATWILMLKPGCFLVDGRSTSIQDQTEELISSSGLRRGCYIMCRFNQKAGTQALSEYIRFGCHRLLLTD